MQLFLWLRGKELYIKRKFKIKRSKEDYNNAKENNKKVVFLVCRDNINFPDHTEAGKKEGLDVNINMKINLE